jgi:Zn finger protein HypA/HybF involved in hydrogenase expression
MTTLIKIKRSSIKKNPDAGKDTTYVPMPWQVTFKTNIPYDLLPDWIRPFVTYRDNIWCSGYLNQIDDKIMEDAAIIIRNGHIFNIEFKREVQTIHSITPESDYLYNYMNTKVECSNCHTKVPVNDIEEDEFEDTLVKICPKCGYWNTFDYKYEKIEDAIRRNK